MIALNLTEHQEQCNLVGWLDMMRIVFFAVPNGGERDPREAVKLRREGVRAGAPDLVLVHCAPINGRPTMIEMKKKKRATYSEEQLVMHAVARAEKWNVIAPPKGHSAQWVIARLRELGYGRKL